MLFSEVDVVFGYHIALSFPGTAFILRVVIVVLHAIIKVFGCVIHVAVNLKYSLKGMLRTATTEFLSVETLASSSSMV